MIDNLVSFLEFEDTHSNPGNIIDMNDVSWMSKKQQRVYEYISQKEYMFLNITRLVSKTDLGKKIVENAFRDARFRKHIEVLRTLTDENYGFTNFEKEMLEFYSNSQNINLHPRSVYKHIKYISNMWNFVKYNRRLVTRLIELGVDVKITEYPIPDTLDDLNKIKYPWINENMLQIFEFMREYPFYIEKHFDIHELSKDISKSKILSSFNSIPFRETYDSFNNKRYNKKFKNQREQKFYEFYLIEDNRKILPVDASRKLFNAHDQWYKCKNNPELIEELNKLGVETHTHFMYDTVKYSEVKRITSAEELINFYNSDVWDLREILNDLPMHRKGTDYVIHFNKIEQPFIRNGVKKYMKLNINTKWKGRTAKTYADKIIIFFKKLYDLFPEIEKISELNREQHILPVINLLGQTDRGRSDVITTVRAMFTFMFLNNMEDAPNTEYLFLHYDKPKLIDTTEPRPLSLYVKTTLDDYLLNNIIPRLESGDDLPFGSLTHWDILIIIRYTGRRIGDVSHLLEDCIKYDSDGDPTLYVDHKFAKIPKDMYVPIAHLNRLSLSERNIVVDAVERQIERVKGLPPLIDGGRYLFRRYNNNINSYELEQYENFNRYFLNELVVNIPLKELDGSCPNITTHMFRHTVGSEMISAGVDIYALKEFLGHESILMTEKYVKLSRKSMKKELYEKGYTTLAAEISTTDSENLDPYSAQWVKNKIVGIFELGDGCCEHLYKMPSCPHVVCKTCAKKKIYPRHLKSVLSTLESSREHLKAATGLGLIDKADELNNIISFYETALEYIEKDEVFIASKDFYKSKGL